MKYKLRIECENDERFESEMIEGLVGQEIPFDDRLARITDGRRALHLDVEADR